MCTIIIMLSSLSTNSKKDRYFSLFSTHTPTRETTTQQLILILQDATFARTIKIPYGRIQHQETIHQSPSKGHLRGIRQLVQTYLCSLARSHFFSLSHLLFFATAVFADVFNQSEPPTESILCNEYRRNNKNNNIKNNEIPQGCSLQS
jgi:hypothetical protein